MTGTNIYYLIIAKKLFIGKLFKGTNSDFSDPKTVCVFFPVPTLCPFFIYCLVLGCAFDGGSRHIAVFQIGGMLEFKNYFGCTVTVIHNHT